MALDHRRLNGENLQILGVITARGGSKGIPNKNINMFSGKPLIAHTIEAAKQSKLTDVIVSTDSEQIANVAREFGATVAMRPPELAQDTTPTLPVIQHVVANYGSSLNAVMTLQPTSPLRTANDIDKSIDAFTAASGADSLTSVVRIGHGAIPELLLKEDGGWLRSNMPNSIPPRRQDAPQYYARNGAIFITAIDQLEDGIVGENCAKYEMDYAKSIDIDSPEDWALAELIHQSAIWRS